MYDTVLGTDFLLLMCCMIPPRRETSFPTLTPKTFCLMHTLSHHSSYRHRLFGGSLSMTFKLKSHAHWCSFSFIQWVVNYFVRSGTASTDGMENPVIPACSLLDGVFSPQWDMLLWIPSGREVMKSGSSLS